MKEKRVAAMEPPADVWKLSAHCEVLGCLGAVSDAAPRRCMWSLTEKILDLSAFINIDNAVYELIRLSRISAYQYTADGKAAI